MIKYITIITLLFFSSCAHTIKIEGNKKGCWIEGHRVKVCGTAISYNSKTGNYKMLSEDGWKININQENITWK